MVSRGGGRKILMSKCAFFQGAGLVTVYATAKAFNTVLGEGLWEELRGRGVDVVPFIAGATTTPNYLRTDPRPGRFGPPLMTAEVVAREALAALGGGPRAVAGLGNRMALFVMERLLARRQRVKIMGRAMRKLYSRDRPV